jgi:putative SOS response-associated peptidase YedK
MCGRYVLASSPEDIAARFSASTGSVDFPVSHNVAPTKTMPVITLRDGDERTAELFRWGIVPTWSRDGATPPPLINARSETVAEKATFRKLLRTQRCLVPANGFYEWERRGSAKVPHFFSVPDEPLIAYAGLYRTPSEKDGDDRPSFTILTTSANELVSRFHDRMPVIVRPEDEDLWLDPDIEQPEALESIYAPFPAGKMAEWTVSTRVNNAAVDSPALIERAQ